MIRYIIFSFTAVTLILLFENCNNRIDKAIEGQSYKTETEIAAVSTIVGIPEKSDPAQALFEEFCTSCHGTHVNAFVDRKWKHGNSKEDIIMSIRDGILNSGMPSYDTTFTAVQLDILSDYILEGIENRESYTADKDVQPTAFVTEEMKVRVETIVTDVDIPWGIKVLADGTIYYTDKKGVLKFKSPGKSSVTVNNLPVIKSGLQGGLMDIALDPEFANNKLLYISYTKENPANKSQLTTAVSKGRLDGDQLMDVEEIFVALPYLETIYHFGSRLVFDKSGFLFITVGDRGKRDDNPQFVNNSCGKVHRINSDGTIPEDNPFYDNTSAIKSIWTYGHRNQQGMVYDETNDRIVTHEHGPRGGDELNIELPGTNYGWPVVSYGINYNGTTFTDITEKKGTQSPINYWLPSIAPSGMAIVKGKTYPKWRDNILTGSLRFNYVSRIKMDGDQVISEERILKNIGRVRSIEMGADGYLYIGVEKPGRILKVVPEK